MLTVTVFLLLEHYTNFDLKSVVTPVDATKLEEILNDSNYDREKNAISGGWI